MRSHWQVLVEEIRREFIIKKRYWADSVTLAILIYISFVMLLLVGGALSGHAVTNEAKASALVGMMIWQLSLGSIRMMGWSFYNEAAAGTLEHLYLSPVSIIYVFLCRSVANFLSNLVVMMGSGAVAIATTGVRLHLPPLQLAVLVPLTVAGAYGFGFLLAALTLTFKRTQSLVDLIHFVFLFFTGSVVELKGMHPAVQVLGEALPLTAGIRALRTIAIEGATLGGVQKDLIQVLITSAAWFAVGIALYAAADRWARRKGSIGQY